MTIERTYGNRPTPGIPARSTPIQPLHRTQAVKSDGTSYVVVDEQSHTVHKGASLERARTETLRASVNALAHLYRLDGAGRLTRTSPIATYVDGVAL